MFKRMNEKDSDKMFTIIITGEPIKGEPIPSREKTAGEAVNNPNEQLYDHHLSKLLKRPSIPQYISSQTMQPSPDVEKAILGLNKNPLKRNFYELAIKNKDRTVEAAPDVPFMCYWPSYELMSEQQLNWYFYLRTKFRSFEYPKADLSYIFLYIYELINGVGIIDSEDGLIRLIKIWNAYKNNYKNLTNYLPEWITDYMDIYNCQPEGAFELLNNYELTSYIPENFIISHYINKNHNMPVELIARLSDYAFYKSNFITKKEPVEQENDIPDNGKLFLKGLPIVIKKIDTLMKNEGQGIFEKFKPDITQQKSKIPFRSAVFEQSLRISASTSAYTSYKPLREFITSIIRHYENALRLLCNYRGKLKEEPLSDNILKLIKNTAEEDFVQSRKKDVIITVDKEKLVRLMKEAEVVRKKLLEPVNEPENNENDKEENIVSVPENIIKEENINISQKTTQYEDWVIVEKTDIDISSQPLTASSDGQTLINLFSDTQQQILKYMIKNKGRCSEKELAGTFKNNFINTETDSINEKSLEVFNDLLIAYEDGFWYIIEDYIDELTELLK